MHANSEILAVSTGIPMWKQATGYPYYDHIYKKSSYS